jgi:Flp pilus assembly pilin Flp
MKKQSLVSLLRKVHNDEQGVVSLETILIIGAIALPILIFLIKIGWPLIQQYFTQGVNTLQEDATAAQTGS